MPKSRPFACSPRREHSRTELQRKLAARGHAAEVIEATLAELAAHGLQSDARFIESYVRSALARGHGERKIRAGLRERGIDCHLLPAGLDLSGVQWRLPGGQGDVASGSAKLSLEIVPTKPSGCAS